MTDKRKVAVITGAGSGIGRATALLFLAEGYNVVVASRTEDKLQETLRLAGDNGKYGLAVSTDVTSPESVKKLFAATKEKFGRVDFLFNNAGAAGAGVVGIPLLDVPFENWKRVIDTNLTGAFLCAQEALRIMVAQNPQGGRIMNNGSVSAQVPRVDAAAYSASKAGITGLTKSISLDFRKYNVACGQIDIGNADSAQASRHASGSRQSDGQVRAEPLISIDDVAKTLLHIANLPLEANVQFITLLATQMPFIGRG